MAGGRPRGQGLGVPLTGCDGTVVWCPLMPCAPVTGEPGPRGKALCLFLRASPRPHLKLPPGLPWCPWLCRGVAEPAGDMTLLPTAHQAPASHGLLLRAGRSWGHVTLKGGTAL